VVRLDWGLGFLPATLRYSIIPIYIYIYIYIYPESVILLLPVVLIVNLFMILFSIFSQLDFDQIKRIN
jgi:ABC-type transport system involved in cytochrome bd biosynthesis fused ATPase/permease subunit